LQAFGVQDQAICVEGQDRNRDRENHTHNEKNRGRHRERNGGGWEIRAQGGTAMVGKAAVDRRVFRALQDASHGEE